MSPRVGDLHAIKRNQRNSTEKLACAEEMHISDNVEKIRPVLGDQNRKARKEKQKR